MNPSDTAPPSPPERPPAAPPEPSPEDLMVAHIARQALNHLSNATSGEQIPAIIASCVRASIRGERERIVAEIKEMSEDAKRQATAAHRGGRGQLAKTIAVAAGAFARAAALIGSAPWAAVCPTCRGSKRVASKVVLAGGNPVAAPCPTCVPPPEEERH